MRKSILFFSSIIVPLVAIIVVTFTLRISSIECILQGTTEAQCPPTIRDDISSALLGKRMFFLHIPSQLNPIAKTHGVAIHQWKRRLLGTITVILDRTNYGIVLSQGEKSLRFAANGIESSVPAGSELIITTAAQEPYFSSAIESNKLPNPLLPLLQLTELTERYNLELKNLTLHHTPTPVLTTENNGVRVILSLDDLHADIAALSILQEDLELPNSQKIREIDLRFDHPVARASSSGSLSPGQQ